MSPEVTVLALAGLWQAVQYVLVSVPVNRELGTDVTLGPRDDGAVAGQVSRGTGRLVRALSNNFEALTLFTLAVVVVELGPGSGQVTAALAGVFLVARILYVPAYRFGWVPWRSLIWATGFAATLLMILSALIVNFIALATA